MSARPTLSDLPSQAKYAAGDRLIARVSTDLTKDEEKKLRKAVVKFAGNDVNVLFVNTSRSQLALIRRQENPVALAEFTMATHESKLRIANIDLLKVDLKPNDELVYMTSPMAMAAMGEALHEWAGKDVYLRWMPLNFGAA